jgi:ATP-binding cassette subfamily C protein
MADGRDIHSNLLSWWSKISLVPQNVFILDETLRRNIALGIPDGQIDEDAVASAIDAAQLSDYIDSLPAGLDTVLGERGVRVSGGQRQRVAIARALYGNPELLFFDEGTAALDTITETALLSALENLRGRYTMISIAHRLASVERCDKIVLLMDGRVVDIGGYEELRQRNPMFGRMAG